MVKKCWYVFSKAQDDFLEYTTKNELGLVYGCIYGYAVKVKLLSSWLKQANSYNCTLLCTAKHQKWKDKIAFMYHHRLY